MLGCLYLAVCVSQSPPPPVIAPKFEVIRIGRSGNVAPFLIGRYEVTNKQFEAFVIDTGYTGKQYPSSKPTETFLQHWDAGRCPPSLERYPVAYVNWHHAKDFCTWLAKKLGREVRLPTDAEWTLAAAGRYGRKYPWGNTWDPKRCNWGEDGKVDGFHQAAPIASFPRGVTPEGVHDMAGNIWEWSLEGNLRGGPWCMGPETVETAILAREDTSRCDDKFGFRICMPGSS